MAVNSRPTKARALGAALRAAREGATDMSLRAFAIKIGKDSSLISRWETGARIPKPADVAQILTALGISGERYDHILGMTEGAEESQWLAVSLPEQRRQLDAVLKFESTAKLITVVSPLLIPGLMQTAAYVRAIMAAGTVPPDEIATRIAVRLGRRDTVIDGEVPFVGFIGEAALRQRIGDHAVMSEQLRHLKVMAKRSNVDLRVIPFDTGWHPALEGAFTMFAFTDEPLIVHIENRRSGLFLHEEDDVSAYQEAVGVLENKAMSQSDSVDLITETITEWEKT